MSKKVEPIAAVPGKTDLPIKAIYAWVMTQPDGGEAIPAIATPDGLTMPLIGADVDRVNSFRRIAENMRRDVGYPVRLVRFGHREVLEELP